MKGPKAQLEYNALLNTGATRSCINHKTAFELGKDKIKPFSQMCRPCQVRSQGKGNKLRLGRFLNIEYVLFPYQGVVIQLLKQFSTLQSFCSKGCNPKIM